VEEDPDDNYFGTDGQQENQ